MVTGLTIFDPNHELAKQILMVNPMIIAKKKTISFSKFCKISRSGEKTILAKICAQWSTSFC